MDGCHSKSKFESPYTASSRQVERTTEGVLINDSDVETPNPLNLHTDLVSTTPNGTLHLYDNGWFSYEPYSGFFGEDTFSGRDRASGRGDVNSDNDTAADDEPGRSTCCDGSRAP